MYRTSTTRSPDRLRAPALAGLALALAACSSGGIGGPEVTQQRGVEAFHSIDLRGAASLDVRVGPASSVSVTGAESAVNRLATHVQNGMLVIEQQGSWFWLPASGDIDVEVTLPELNSLAVNGAGDVDVSGLAGNELTLVLQGAGNIEAQGRVETLTARINGAGNMDLAELLAADVTATVNGAGNMQVNAGRALTATLNGVGSIRYRGNPGEVNSSVNGVGSISPHQP